MDIEETSNARKEKIKKLILSLCTGEGLTSRALKKECRDISNSECENAVNSLLAEKRISMFTDKGTETYFVTVSEEQQRMYKGLSHDEVIVFRLIEDSGDIGIWSKQIKYKTKFAQKEIAKILKSLESKKLIKSIKSIKRRNRKVYMLVGVVPSEEITGGIWYDNQEYDVDMISVLSDFVLEYINEKKVVTVSSALDELKRRSRDDKIEIDKGKVQNLTEENLQSIFNILHYDGAIEFFQNNVSYKESNLANIVNSNSFIDVPCSTCPVFQKCTTEGNISPTTCVYLKEWQQY